MTKKSNRIELKVTAAAAAVLLVLLSLFSGTGSLAVSAAEDVVETDENGTASFGNGTASIEIRGNEGQSLVGKEFNVYKLFAAENAPEGGSVNYTMNSEYETALKNVAAAGISEGGTHVGPDEVTGDMAADYIRSISTGGNISPYRLFIEKLTDELARLGLKADKVKVDFVKSGNSVVLEGLDCGYYLIEEVTNVQDRHCAASLCMTDTAGPAAEIEIKSDYPSVTKKIKEDDGCDDIKDAYNWNDIGDFEIGQTVPYRFESDIPDMNGYETYYCCWHDRMDEALTFLQDSVRIEISGKDAQGADKTYELDKKEFTLNTDVENGESFMVSIEDIKAIADREFPRFDGNGRNVYGQKVTVTYNAVLNDNAAGREGRPGFENDVRLEFSNCADTDGEGSTGFTPWDTAVCFTYKLKVFKINDRDSALDGAKFRLYSNGDCTDEVFVKEGNEGYIVINRDSLEGTDHTGGNIPEGAAGMESDEDGTLVIHGLDGGVYYLKETEAPKGYRLLEKPVVLTVKPEYTDSRDDYVKGDGAALAALKAKAHVKTFFEGTFFDLSHDSSNGGKYLKANAQDGEVQLIVINRVQKELPVTGTHGLIILFASGVVIMSASLITGRKRTKSARDNIRRGIR